MTFQNTFAEKLFETVSSDIIDPTELNELSDDMMDAFLDFGSETDDNMNAYRKIEYNVSQETIEGETSSVIGLKLKGKNVLISSIANALEALKLSDIPESVKQFFPAELTDMEWDAITRTMTMTLIALERAPESAVDGE